MAHTPNVLLRGGSVVPHEERVRYVADTTEKFKLFLGNRYEHFEPTESRHAHDDGGELHVFEWVRRTYVAE
ncbi:DUF5988 family protein [Streptomyces sp. NPDC059002]|uniref:DUF5988 family protein n=1 Tax=Streptomyces sp. NPDC059002 TaxID=3346690 RepID=UPI0036B8D344